MKAAKKRPAKEVGSTDIVNRLRAAREIALACYYGSEAALFNFVTPDADLLARTDYDGFKRHVELWFSRWDAALQDFDATIDGDLWERIEFAARDLGPMDIAGFQFSTAHQAARQSLQWWVNRRIGWEAKRDAIELLETAGNPWLNLSPSLGIDARIRQECKLAERVAAHDNQKNGEENLPLNSDVRDLCLFLRTKRTKFRTNIECVREFCQVNKITDKRPEDMFRQAQRFPHLWQ